MDGQPSRDDRVLFRELRRRAFARRGFDARELFVRDPQGRRTAVLDHGTGDATVLVHGGVGVTAEWAPIAARLPGRIVIPDRPGFGLSDPRDVRTRGLRSEAASWLAELVDGLGLDRVDLVGSSMGGFVAIAFAVAHPQRVRRLVLTGAAGGLFPDPGLFLRLWGSPVIGAVISRLMPRDIEAVRRRAIGGYVVHPDRVPEDLLAVALAAMRLPGWSSANRELLRSVTGIRGWRSDERLDEELVSSGVHTTFIVGDRDRLTTPAAMQALAARMPEAAVTVIPDAGHIPHLDHPDEVAAAVAAALRPGAGGADRRRMPRGTPPRRPRAAR